MEKEREFDSFYLYALPIWNVPFSVSVILQIFSFSAFVINPMHWILLGIFSILKNTSFTVLTSACIEKKKSVLSALINTLIGIRNVWKVLDNEFFPPMKIMKSCSN